MNAGHLPWEIYVSGFFLPQSVVVSRTHLFQNVLQCEETRQKLERDPHRANRDDHADKKERLQIFGGKWLNVSGSHGLPPRLGVYQ